MEERDGAQRNSYSSLFSNVPTWQFYLHRVGVTGQRKVRTFSVIRYAPAHGWEHLSGVGNKFSTLTMLYEVGECYLDHGHKILQYCQTGIFSFGCILTKGLSTLSILNITLSIAKPYVPQKSTQECIPLGGWRLVISGHLASIYPLWLWNALYLLVLLIHRVTLVALWYCLTVLQVFSLLRS